MQALAENMADVQKVFWSDKHLSEGGYTVIYCENTIYEFDVVALYLSTFYLCVNKSVCQGRFGTRPNYFVDFS